MFAPGHHGYPRASRLTKREASKGQIGTQSHGCAGQTVRPSLHSISQALAGEAVDPKLLGLMFDVREITWSHPLGATFARSPNEASDGGEGGAGVPLVDLSEPLSHGICSNPRLVGLTSRENRPSDAGEFVGERPSLQL